MTPYERMVRWTRVYYLLQAVAIALWWALLWVEPWTRTYFMPASFDDRVLLALALPDWAVLVGSSLVCATPGPPALRAACAWIAAGGAVYATLFSLATAWFTGSAWISVLAMLPMAAASVACAWLAGGMPVFRTARPAASPVANLAKTFFQVLLFWGTFLVLLPALIRNVEDELHIRRWELAGEWQFPAGIALFVAFSCLGLWSAVTMATLGGGTPLPLDAPNRLVIHGPYAYVRNPMAVAGLGQGLAVAIATGSTATLLYVALGSLAWNFTARPLEEFDMEEKFGDRFISYRHAVRCWVPRIPAYTPRANPNARTVA